MEKTLNYYKENYGKIFEAIENPQWRIFKIIEEGGFCRQNKFQITTPEKLWKFIKQCKNPTALYVSISEFLNPHKNHGFFSNQKITAKNGHYFYPRSGFIYSDCILLPNSYFFIDIDGDNLKDTQYDARKIIIYMNKKKDYKLKELNFSGTKGVHLLYEDLKKRKIKDPIKRIKHLTERKKELANELIKLGLKTIDRNHLNIMVDVFRVRAMLYSIKSNGNIVTPLDKDEFMKYDIYDILGLSKPTRVNKLEVARDGKPDDKKVASDERAIFHPQQYKNGQRASIISHSISNPVYFKFVDNMINGLKDNYITALKINQKNFKIKKLKELQKIYKLSDFYIAKIGSYIYAYNLKALQFERVVKIMRKAKSENLSFFMTRKHLPIQVSAATYDNGDIADEIEFVGVLKSEYGLNDAHSRPHSMLFKTDYKNMVGNLYNNVGTMKVA